MKYIKVREIDGRVYWISTKQIITDFISGVIVLLIMLAGFYVFFIRGVV